MDGGPFAVIGVVGPTGVGKTEAAVRLAREFGGEIVSCDSVQLYRCLDIGSAKPSPAERSAVPHHLIDIYPPDFQIDVGIYKAEAEKAILSVHGSGKLPVVCGGTGMYFNSLYYGLVDAPSRSDELRNALEERVEVEGLESLYRELSECDPASAKKILPNDKRRIVRALEVFRSTGTPLSEIKKENKKMDLDWLVIGLTMDRAALYARVNERVDRMIAVGLVEETRSVMEKFGPAAFALGSIGYRHARNFINGTWSLDEMTETLKRDTRRYVKRQMTWFKKNRDIRWFDPSESGKISSCVNEFLKEKSGAAS